MSNIKRYISNATLERPMNTAHWYRDGQETGSCIPMPHKGKGLLWQVTCNYCGINAQRTTREINNDVHRCDCRTSNRATIMLTYEGNSKTLANWAVLYPYLNKQTIRNRLSQRALGIPPCSTWSDAQILFGKKGVSQDNETHFSKVDEINAVDKITVDLALVMTRELQSTVDDVMKARFAPMLKAARATNNVVIPPMAGRHFHMNNSDFTISEYLAMGLSFDDVKIALENETFATPEEKTHRLTSYIPDEAINTNELVLTKVEQMLLMSIFPKS